MSPGGSTATRCRGLDRDRKIFVSSNNNLSSNERLPRNDGSGGPSSSHLLPQSSTSAPADIARSSRCGLQIAARIGALTAAAAHQEEERRLSLLQNRLNETIDTTTTRLASSRPARQCQRCQSHTSQLFLLRTSSTSDPDTQAILWHTAHQIARRHPTIYRSQKRPASPQPPEDILRCAIFRELQPHGVHLCFGCISCAIIPLSWFLTCCSTTP